MKGSRPPAVVDTNVLVSAYLFPESTAGCAFRKLLQKRTALGSLDTLREFRLVFTRKKFEGRLALAIRLTAIREYEAAVSLVSVEQRIRACRDPGDDSSLS